MKDKLNKLLNLIEELRKSEDEDKKHLFYNIAEDVAHMSFLYDNITETINLQQLKDTVKMMEWEIKEILTIIREMKINKEGTEFFKYLMNLESIVLTLETGR